MRSHTGYLLLVAAGLAGVLIVQARHEPGGSAGPPAVRREETESGAEWDAEHALKAQLRDGESAQFRNEKAYRQPNGSFIVCGEVNAKNGFGGYSGFETFVAAGAAIVTRQGWTSNRKFQQFVNNMCQTNSTAPSVAQKTPRRAKRKAPPDSVSLGGWRTSRAAIAAHDRADSLARRSQP